MKLPWRERLHAIIFEADTRDEILGQRMHKVFMQNVAFRVPIVICHTKVKADRNLPITIFKVL